MGREYKRTAFVVLALVLFCLNTVAQSQTRSAESKIESLMREVNDVVKREAHAAELIIRAEDYYRQGEKLFKNHEPEKAQAYFQKAVQMVSVDSTGSEENSRVREYYLELLGRIKSLTSTAKAAEKQELTNGAVTIIINDSVMRFMQYFLGPGREKFEIGWERLNRYKDIIKGIFAEEGLPLDLIYVAQIESLYDHNALSEAGAKGLWQFMPNTGRRYGLMVSWRIDERSDPVKSTRAAARYLKDLYGMFGDWFLALAAYNAGENRIVEAIERSGGMRDFWVLAARGLLPKETTDYVPAALAAIMILKRPEEYGFTGSRLEHFSSSKPLSGEAARLVDNPKDLSNHVKTILEGK